MKAAREYKIINEALAMFGYPAIEPPKEGSDRQKVEYLLDAYAARLKENFPQYRIFNDNRKIPEMIILYLVSVLDGKK